LNLVLYEESKPYSDVYKLIFSYMVSLEGFKDDLKTLFNEDF